MAVYDTTGASNGSGNKNEFESLSWRLGAWSDTTGFPQSVAIWSDRMFWAGTTEAPRSIAFTYTDKLRGFTPSAADGTVTDANGGFFEIRDRSSSPILWLAEGPTKLLIGTEAAVHSLGASNADPFGPRNVLRRRETDDGTTRVTPARAATSTLHTMQYGNNLRDLYYDPQSGSLVSPPFAAMSDHLFSTGVVALAVANSPRTVVWALLADGTLVASTVDRYERVVGFSRIDVSGKVASICVTPSGNGYDELTIAVDRVINGVAVRYMEVLDQPFTTGEKEDAFFVDCGTTYIGVPTKQVTGVSWLEGQTVDVLAGGYVVSPKPVVTGGVLSLPALASKISFGLPIDNHVRTLRAPVQGRDGSALGRRTRVVSAIFDVFKTLGLAVFDSRGGRFRVNERMPVVPFGQSPPLHTGEIKTLFNTSWDSGGVIEFEAPEPLPATVRAININLEVEP